MTVLAVGMLGAASANAQTSRAPVARAIPSPTIPDTTEATQLSGISGVQGDVTRVIDRNGPVRSLEFGELGDRPCIINLRSYEGQPFRDAIVDQSQCSGRINTSQYWMVSVSEGQIHGMQACYNRRSGRLKGLRVFYNDGEYDQTASEIQYNCGGNRGRWADRVDCPPGMYLRGLRAHFRQEPRNRTNPIIGLQMLCASG